MLKTLLAAAAFATALSGGTAALAQHRSVADGHIPVSADRYQHNASYEHDAWRSDRRPHGHRHAAPRRKTLEVRVDRHVRDAVFPLRRMLGLDASYRGYRVESVRVELKPRPRRTRMALMTNGVVADRQSAKYDRSVELTPGANRTLGHDLETLQLAVHGKAFIRDIQVTLVPHPRYHRGRHGHRRGHHHGTWHGDDWAWRLIFEGPLFGRRN